MPVTAANLAHFLGKLAAPIEDLRRRAVYGPKAYERLSNSLTKLLNTVLSIGLLPVIIIFAVTAIDAAVSNTLTVSWLIPQLLTFLIQLLIVCLSLLLLSLLLYFTVVAGSDFANQFVEGRAVGTLGIMLATVGVMMEFYQLITVV